jgi:hypothetical protein
MDDFKHLGVVCIDEHWLSSDQCSHITVGNFSVANHFARKQHTHGGTLILVRNDIRYNVLAIEPIEIHFEACAIRLYDFNLCILSVYRSPLGNFSVFVESLYSTLNNLGNCKNIILCADFNVDLLCHSRNRDKLLDIFNTFNMFIRVTTPTRVTSASRTCIDNIATNVADFVCKAQNLAIDFSDHDVQILHLYKKSQKYKQSRVIHKLGRKYSISNGKKFENILSSVDWSELYSDETENKIEVFYKLLNASHDTAFPLSKIKCDPEHKWWITSGIKISSKTKRDLFLLTKSFPQ